LGNKSFWIKTLGEKEMNICVVCGGNRCRFKYNLILKGVQFVHVKCLRRSKVNRIIVDKEIVKGD
jgi:hypothetical protein